MELTLRSAAYAALAFCALSCAGGASPSQKAEAGRISRAIDQLRAAPNAQKHEFFSSLAGASCETTDLCELKRICLAGYSAHLSGLRQTSEAKQLLANGGTDAAVTAALDAAKASLLRAEPELARCADAQGAAVRKYKP